MAASSGPGGPCQPHTVQQLTEEGVGGGWAVWRGDKGDQEEERILTWQKERERERGTVRVLCPSWAELHLLAHFQQEVYAAS